MVEPGNIREGMMLARTLLATPGEMAYVHVLNTKSTSCVIAAEQIFAKVKPVELESEQEVYTE